MRFCETKENCCSRSRTYSSASESKSASTFALASAGVASSVSCMR